MTGERAQQPLPFAYVHTPKAAIYRQIMRAFVERKRRFLVHSRPEDIAEALGEESVESALSALVEWGNLATHRPRNDGGVTVERGDSRNSTTRPGRGGRDPRRVPKSDNPI